MNKVELLTIEEENIEDEKLRPTGQQTDLRSPSGHSNSDFINRLTGQVFTMEHVIERLRLSKETKIEQIVHEGWVNGTEWAKLYAEYDELRCMAQVGARGAEYHGGAYRLFAKVTGRTADYADEMAAFYLIREGEVLETATYEFVMGFIEGARTVWYDVVYELPH